MEGFDLSRGVALVAAFLVPGLFAITLHEVAHGWMARQFGDRTAEMLGRLTLNPLKHIDPVGTVLVPITLLVLTGFAFGWAKPVPVSARNMRNPRRDMIYVAAAGPAANFLMAFGWAVLLGLVVNWGQAGGALTTALLAMCNAGVIINVILGVFNLLPVPPLDGGRVLSGLLPPSASTALDRVEPFGIVIVLALLMTGVLWNLIGPVIAQVAVLIRTLAGVG